MNNIQELYKEKPELVEKLFEHLSEIKYKLKSESFQIINNEDELEIRKCSENKNEIGYLVGDYERLFSKSINESMNFVENNIENFEKYKFISFENLNNSFFLNSVIDVDNNLVDINEAAKELNMEVLPNLFNEELSYNDFVNLITSSDIDNFINESVNKEDISGLVFSFNIDNKIAEYELSVSENNINESVNRKDDSEFLSELYEFYNQWSEENTISESDNRLESIQKNFINMMSDYKVYSKLMNLGSKINLNESIQFDRCCDEAKKEIKKHGGIYKNLLEHYIKLFYYTNENNLEITEKFCNYIVNEDLIEINNILIINESKEEIKTNLKEIIDNINNDKTLNKINNYVSSLDSSNKDILYNWCWLKYPDSKKINNFYKELKTALRSSVGFKEFIELCKSQLQKQTNESKTTDSKTKSEINNYKLKDENDESFYKIDFNEKPIGSFNLKDILSNKWKKISIETWDAIHNITFGPQPVVGKSEILFKTFSHPGNNNKFGGDVLMFNNGVEIKDHGETNSKLGRPDILNTEPIFNFLGIKEKTSISATNKKIFSLINKEYLTKENFKQIFNNYFSDKDKNSQIKKIIDELSESIVNSFIETINDNDIQTFMNIWGVFYLFCYSVIENFNIFICTSHKDNICYDYNYIVLNNKDKELFKEILSKKPFITYNIRKSGGWIDITFVK